MDRGPLSDDFRRRTAMNVHSVSIYDKPPPGPTRRAWWRFVERHLPTLVIYLMVMTLVAIVLAPVMYW